MKKIIVLLFISTLLLGCLTTSNESILNLESGKGIVVFNATSKNMSKFELYYTKDTSIMDLEGLLQMNKTVLSKDSYDIMIVSAGDYKFSKINKDGKLLDFPESEGFTVEAGKVVYVGDLSINYNRQAFEDNLAVEVEDKQDTTLEAATKDLPALADYEVVKDLIVINQD